MWPNIGEQCNKLPSKEILLNCTLITKKKQEDLYHPALLGFTDSLVNSCTGLSFKSLERVMFFCFSTKLQRWFSSRNSLLSKNPIYPIKSRSILQNPYYLYLHLWRIACACIKIYALLHLQIPENNLTIKNVFSSNAIQFDLGQHNYLDLQNLATKKCKIITEH